MSRSANLEQALSAAGDAVAQVRAGRSLSDALQRVEAAPSLGAAVQDLAYGTLRNLGLLDALLAQLLRKPVKPALHALLLAALYQLRARPAAFQPHHLVPLVPGGLGAVRGADLLSRFVADADRIQDLYLRALGPPLVALAAGALAVAAAAIMLPAAGLVVAAVLLLAGVAAPYLVRRVARRSGRRQAPARAALTADMVAIAGGAPEIVVAGREEDWERRAAASSARLGRALRGNAAAAGLAAGTAVAVGAAGAAAMAAVAIPAVRDGTLAGVLLAALVLLALASLEAVAPLGAAAASLDAVSSAAARLEAVTARPVQVAAPPAPRPLPDDGPLAVHGVSFRYDSGAPGSTASTWCSSPGGPWGSSGRAARARARWPSCSSASATRPPAR